MMSPTFASRSLWLAAAVAVMSLSASAQTQQASLPAAITSGNAIEVTSGSGAVFTPPAPVTRIALANEALAKVTLLSSRELLIHGTAPGTTTLFMWLETGERIRHQLNVRHDLTALQKAMEGLDKRIVAEESPDGGSIALRGDVDDALVALNAGNIAEAFFKSQAGKGPTIVNLLKYPVAGNKPINSDVQLALAMQSIDSRIRVRRIQVGPQSEPKTDSLILEGRVKSISDLSRAVMLADRQLGGSGLQLKVADNSRIKMARMSGNASSAGGGGGAGIQGLTEDNGTTQNGLANHLARKLVVSSESGRVISFLEVDQIDQILVAIRVFEIDRSKARGIGVNYRIDGESFSVGHYTPNTAARMPVLFGKAASVTDAGVANLVGAYVDESIGIMAAMDFMQEKKVARAVATPNVMTLTGEKASVVVGGEVPIPSTAVGEVAAVKGYSFQSFGVRLDIRPTTGDDGIITIEVAPSIIRPDDKLNVDGVPGFKVESVETTARVKTGQSLVLGGLLNYEETQTERKVPLLGDLPLIGYLFKWDGRSRAERELVFVITPNLLNGATDGLKGTLDLPSGDTLDDGLNVEHAPQTLEPDGRPTLWTKPNPQAVPRQARNPATDAALFKVGGSKTSAPTDLEDDDLPLGSGDAKSPKSAAAAEKPATP